MSLLVNLSIKDRKLLYQQDADCTVILKNAGSRPISVGAPPQDPTEPTVQLLNMDSGVEKSFRGELEAGESEDVPYSLPPGQSITEGFSLLGLAKDLLPGKYEVRAIWGWNQGAEQSTSNAVVIEVLPTTPRGLVTANGVAGDSTLKFGAWVNMAEDPPNIARCGFSVMPGAEVTSFQRVAKCHPLSPLAISAPGMQHYLDCQWIAWLDEGFLKFAHVDSEAGVSKVQQMKVPDADVSIVPPLYCSPRTNPSIRPGGAALLRIGLPGATQFRLQTIELTVDKAKSLGAGNAKGKPPDWIQGYARRIKEWLVTWIHAHGLHVILNLGEWPGLKDAALGEKKLADWPGRFVAAAAAMGRDLEIHGGVLMWEFSPGDELAEEKRTLVMRTWQLSPENEFSEGEPLEVQWDPNEPIQQARVSVSDVGVAAALLMDGEDKWKIFDGQDSVVPAPTAFEQTELPLEIAFLEGDGDPVLIGAKLQRGFKMVGIDGVPIPPPEK